MTVRSILFALGALGLAGCIEMPTAGNQPEVIVRHRCGDTNFDDMSGSYGKMQGENGINPKVRVLFESTDGKLTAKWVPGGHARYGTVGEKTSNDTAVFTEPGSGTRFRAWATLTNDCRIEVTTGTVDGSGVETKSPEPPMRFASFPELASRDYEPCTERLYWGKAARSWSNAKGSKAPTKPGVTHSSDTTIAAYGSQGEVGPGCTARFDVWTDGQAMDARNVETVEKSGDKLRWFMPYTHDYIGLHGIAMHRKVQCEGEDEKLLGVACVEIEVK